MPHLVVATILMLVCAAAPAYAQAVEGLVASTGELTLPFAIEGPPPPELPATMARDAEGRVTVRAVRLAQPLRVDGALDEALYSSYQPLSDFVQIEPAHGEAATEKSEVWIAFDADHVYIGFRTWESQPDRLVANEMRRDANSIWQSESISFALDTFYDRRNSLNFYLNVVGGRMDGQVTNESSWSSDWNPVWDFAVRRTPEGWTGEAAIPFKSIRYQAGRQQVWGLQIRRVNRWKNEQSYLTPLPMGNANNALFRMSRAATLVGIEAPASGLALDIKPYVTSGLSTDLSATPQLRNDVAKDVGLDVKYGLTRSLAADFTYNTDFAQVEADEQQVNLTRFSLFFPEKREFFLENAGIFNFGNAGNNFGGGNFTSDAPMLFYSRRIGLDAGQIVPIEAGGRLSGRAGKYALGLINIQTDDVPRAGIPSTNFSVARVRRDILRRSAIGAMATRRSAGGGESYGVDGAFAFFTNLNIQAYWARTVTPGINRG
ncbi:MAG: carbohydrate binding family 9 domain-containing protein, partial [Acidimicrobiia bacterium]|nr:carbohydrate binding family 9 domain-containing protein [Acidimicrobiia bacterium]